MTLFIKICGIRDGEAAHAAANAGANAIGLVFAESARRVDIRTAKEVVCDLPWHMQHVVVLRSPGDAPLGELDRELKPDWLQIDAESLPGANLDPGLRHRVLPVYRDREPDTYPPVVLFESARSGAGQLANWETAARIARKTRLILAGGLNPENVGQAIREVRPWGVDVSSGVESTPGAKDPELIYRFVRAAREASSVKDNRP